MRRTLKWVNKRNPYRMLNFHAELPAKCVEEGGDDVKSARPLCPGLHTSYNGCITTGLQLGNWKLILQKHPQFGLRAAIRPHEAEIASNRGSAGRGEYVLGSCTHRPSSQQSRGCPKCLFLGPKAKPAMGTKSFDQSDRCDLGE